MGVGKGRRGSTAEEQIGRAMSGSRQGRRRRATAGASGSLSARAGGASSLDPSDHQAPASRPCSSRDAMLLLLPSPALVGQPTHALTFARYGARAFAVASTPPPAAASSPVSASARPAVGRASSAAARRPAALPTAAQVVQAARDARACASAPLPSVRSLVDQAAGRDSAVLPFELAYESTPACSRRVDLDAAAAAAKGIAGVGVLAVVQGESATASLAFAVGVEGDLDRTVVVVAEAPKVRQRLPWSELPSRAWG